MGIFNHHHATQSNLGAATNKSHMSGEENENSSTHGAFTSTHSTTSGSKSACGCGCAHKTKPIDEEVVEVKEEWDY